MKEFINPDFKNLLTEEGMADFESLWNRDDPWFEKPNKGRSKNGWSGVCRLTIGTRNFFLKKQQNFFAYSIKKPFGESLVEREYENLKMFNLLSVPCMTVVYFGVRKGSGGLEGLLMTEALDDYISLDDLCRKWQDKDCSLLLIHFKTSSQLRTNKS